MSDKEPRELVAPTADAGEAADEDGGLEDEPLTVLIY